MTKSNIILLISGLIIVLFAVFPASIIVSMHSMTRRNIIGSLGCFSLVFGIYKMVVKK